MATANPLEETRKRRLQFMQAVYELTNANEHKVVSMWEVGQKLGFGGFGSEETQKIVQYLTGEGLIEGRALGGGVGITHYGIKEVEESMSRPDEPTEHFPRRDSVTIINVGSMSNSQMQVNSPNANQTLTISESKMAELKDIIKLLKDSMDSLELGPQQKENLAAEVQTIESQLRSSQPRLRTISDSLSAVKDILSNTAKIATAAAPLIAKISMWLLGAGG